MDNTTHLRNFQIPAENNKAIKCISFGLAALPLAMIFTHGAGGTITSPAILNFAKGFSDKKRLTCFQGNLNMQSRIKMFKRTIEYEGGCDVLGGRSMGARAAISTSQENQSVRTLVLVSFPLKHNGQCRDQLLLDIREEINVLFVVGDRDPLCNINDLTKVIKKMKARTWLVIVKGANHSMDMKPKTATEAVGRMTGKLVAEWLDQRDENRSKSEIHWDDDENQVIMSDWIRTDI